LTQQQPTGGIAVTTRHYALEVWRMGQTARIFLDGYQVAQGWGRRVFASWAGRHRVHVHVRYWGQDCWGADIDVDVYPGHLVELQYTTPGMGFLPRATLEYVPQG
jgi:hypothetical protein